MILKTRILTIIALLFATPAWAEEMLSSNDLQEIFQTSLEDWNANSKEVASLGIGSIQDDGAQSALALTVATPAGAIETKPVYLRETKSPFAVIVRIGLLKVPRLNAVALKKNQARHD